MDNAFFPKTTDELLEVLCRNDPAHGIVMKAQRGEYAYNWLDAASSEWLADNTENIILSLAGTMVIRYTALVESEFARNGYTADDPIGREVVSQHLLKEAEGHRAFYLKTQERVVKLERLDSINRRSFEVIRFSEAKAAPVEPDPDWAKVEPAPATTRRDLYQLYELMRRSNIAEQSQIVRGQGPHGRDWLDETVPTVEETNAIMIAGATRMAIRASLRLEKAWRQDAWINNDWPRHKTDIMVDLRRERDNAVDSYLKTRESLARMEHSQGIVARSTGVPLRKPRRPYAKRKKMKSA